MAAAVVPQDLKAVPADCLQSVCDALALLQESGLSDVSNIEDLHSQIATSLIQVDGYTTENTAMSEWAQTPERWRGAERPDPRSACKLEGMPPQEIASQRAAACEQHQAALAALQGNQAEGDEHYKRWLQAQAAAEAELQMLAGPSTPQSLGAGSSAMFTRVLPSVSREAPPPIKPKRLPVSMAHDTTVPPRKFLVAPSALTVHVGGVGCGMGLSLWQRLCREHGIGPDGMQETDAFGNAAFHFYETSKRRFVPRSVLVDANPSGLQGARDSGIFAPDDFTQGTSDMKEDNWAEAFYGGGKIVVAEAMESLRAQQEKADRVSAILYTHSMYEGASGGLASRFLKDSSGLCSKSTLTFNLVRSPPLKAVASWPATHFCNTLLSMNALVEHSDMVLFVDEAALKQAAVEGLGITSPAENDYNDLLSRVLTACTSPMRMSTSIPATEGTQRMTMQSIVTGLTPYPRIHFAVPSVAPLSKGKTVRPDDADATGDVAWQGITAGKLSSMDPASGKNISMALLCRGILHGTARERFAEWRTKRSCVYCDWSPTGLVLGTHRDPIVAGGCEAVGLHNHTGVRSLLESWSNSYDQLCSGVESRPEGYATFGMEESEFSEAREDLRALSTDYTEVAAETIDDVGEEEEEE